MYPSRIQQMTDILEEQDEPMTTRALAQAVGCRSGAARRTLDAMVKRGEVTHCGVDDAGMDVWA